MGEYKYVMQIITALGIITDCNWIEYNIQRQIMNILLFCLEINTYYTFVYRYIILIII